MNRLIVLDGNALLHRAFHALPPLTSPDGQPVGAVYGFLSMIIRLQHDLQASHMAVCFDRPKPTFRNELFPEYQAQRPPMDEALVPQIGLTHQAVEAMSIPVFEQDGYEADDIIGSIIFKMKNLQSRLIDQCIIVTGDRDILQLVVNDSVLVYMPVKGLSEAKLYGENEVIERLGVTPSQIPDWKGLCGDPSDNYPGVSGIGPKTASDLIKRYSTIERIYEAIDSGTQEISPKIQEKLIRGKSDALLSKNLALIRTEVPIELDFKALQLQSFQSEETIAMLTRFGFPSLIKRIALQAKATESLTPIKEDTKQKDSEQMSLL